MADSMELFARTIHAAKKYVGSSTLNQVDWNAELVRGDQLGKATQQPKRRTVRRGCKAPAGVGGAGIDR